MTSEELNREISFRGLDRHINLNKKLLKKDNERILKDELRGISRTPAMFFGNEFSTIDDLKLSHYEVCPIEPLHDCKGHVKNVWDVLPEILNAKEKIKFHTVIESSIGQKDKVRGSDYRLSTIQVFEIKTCNI